MKLERYEIYSDTPFEPILDERGVFTFCTPELQEAWDKQQEVIVEKNSYGVRFCSKCRGSVWQNRDESNYCFRCGTKLKWEDR